MREERGCQRRITQLITPTWLQSLGEKLQSFDTGVRGHGGQLDPQDPPGLNIHNTLFVLRRIAAISFNVHPCLLPVWYSALWWIHFWSLWAVKRSNAIAFMNFFCINKSLETNIHVLFQWKIFVEKGAEPGPGASLLRPRELRLRLPCAQHRLLQQWRPLRRREPEVSGGWPFCHRSVASERSRDTQLPEYLKASGEKVIYNEKIQSDKEYLPTGRAKNSTNLRNQRYTYTLWI